MSENLYSGGFIGGFLGIDPADINAAVNDAFGTFDIPMCRATVAVRGTSVRCRRPEGHEAQHIGEFQWPNVDAVHVR